MRTRTPSRRYAKGAMPAHVAPMLATLSEALPAEERHWGFEFKWDGVRAIAHLDRGGLRLDSRNLLDITPRYPELQALHAALEGRSAILDGEIVTLDERDRPSFALLQRRMHVQDAAAIRRLADEVPAHFFIFDLLYLDGRSLLACPWTVRRKKLEALTLVGGSWQVPPARVGEGKSVLQAARRFELEGIVAKRLDSIYRPGARNGDWRKIKIVQARELVVGGWLPMRSASRVGVGALLVGYYEAPCGGAPALRYAGKVGSGMSAADHRLLLERLRPLQQEQSPFADPTPRDAVHFVRPKLIVEVEYRRWPAGGLIQQAAYKGLRTDKRPEDVVMEDRQCLPGESNRS